MTDSGAAPPAGNAPGEWPPRRARELALRQIEARIAKDPDAVPARLDRADLLAELGRIPEARDAYLDVLARAPSHCLALNRLGTLLWGTGYRTAAQTAFAQAAAQSPADPLSHVNLANALYQTGDFASAREHYQTALRHAPDYPEAHQGLAYVLMELGDPANAAQHRRLGFEHHAFQQLPYRGEAPPVPLLLLVSAVGGNIPTRHFLDDRVFETTVAVSEFVDRTRPLPPHRLIFNAIGDADLAGEGLAAAQSLVAASSAPVLNSPAAVMATRRVDIARRLGAVPGVIAPRTVTLPRQTLAGSDAAPALAREGLHFPMLLRSPGFHTGRHFVRVESAADLPAILQELPGEALTAIEYLDSRGGDGKVRKYRVMAIGGRLYPLHVAIAGHWKIHYFTADMAANQEHRAEDGRFLENMPSVLGPRAIAALQAIQDTLGLDYFGIDFGLSPAGDVLLFESNATMVVNPPEPGERWDYRRPAVARIFAAVRRLLLEKAGASDESAAIKPPRIV